MLLPLHLNLPEFAVNEMTLHGSILSSRLISIRGGGLKATDATDPIDGIATTTGRIDSGAVIRLRGGSYQK